MTALDTPRRAAFRWPHPVAIATFWLGAVLACSFLTTDWGQTVSGWARVALVAALVTACWVGTGLGRAPAGRWRWLGGACWLPLAAAYLLWAYLAVVFGYLLGWTVPGWTLALVGLLAAGTLATARRPRDAWHVPGVLPLGLWIAVVLSGWLREEQLVRCDDLAALPPPVELVVPTPALAACRPGAVLPSGRFPRTIWQAPDGDRIIFTTQGLATPDGWQGSVCEARLDGPATVHCVGPPVNKSQGMIEVPEEDVLLVLQWGVPTPDGPLGGVVFEVPRRGTLAIRAAHWLDELVGDAFYEPRNGTLYMFSDRMNGIHPLRVPGFERQPTIASSLAPGEVRYDPERGEGVACGQGLGVAIRGAPYSERNFARANTSPLDRVSLTWGCDWDPVTRDVYSTVPNLGLLDRIDYDTGLVEQRWVVGPGMRSVAYDQARQRVYFTNFLRGEVLAFDLRSERIVDRWFVGRFSRWVRLSRDGRALLATGNLGIVRIPLPES